MKRILGIILTAVFFMTLCVPAYAYEEAAAELVRLGVMEGAPDGNLRLDDTITRAEAAKMIAAFFGMDDFAPAETVFEDVQENYWASGYINFAYANGIVNGTSEKIFEPEENVTNEQLIKMLVCALGYAPTAETFGGYPFGYLQLADKLGITKDLDFTGTNASKRGEAAVMFYNGIDIPILRQTSFGANAEYMIMNGKNGVALETPRTEFLEKTTENTDSDDEISGDEYVGRVVKVSELVKSGNNIMFKNSLDSNDDKVYIITETTRVHESTNTLPKEDIAENMYAQCWHYNNGKSEQELVKIEIMKEKPQGAD